MSYEVTTVNSIWIQYAYDSYLNCIDEDTDPSGSTKLSDVAKKTIYQEGINPRHQNPLSARVVLCKDKSEGRDTDNSAKDSSRDVQQRISAGGSVEKSHDGKVNSQADVSYSLSSKDKESDRELKGSVRAGVEDRDGKASCSVRVDVDYSF